MEEKSFLATFLDKIMINMTSCLELEEETYEEGVSKENCSEETDKTVATLEAIPVCLNWGQIFSLPNETRQHMVATLQHPKIYAERVKVSVPLVIWLSPSQTVIYY